MPALLANAKATWDDLSTWVKLLAALGAAVTVLSQFSGVVLSVTLDDRYLLATEAKSYVTAVEFNRQIGDVKKIQLDSERRRLRDELYKLKAMNRPQDRQRILQLEDDIKDIERQLRRLEQGR